MTLTGITIVALLPLCKTGLHKTGSHKTGSSCVAGMVELHEEVSKGSHTAFPAWNFFSHLSFKPASCVD